MTTCFRKDVIADHITGKFYLKEQDAITSKKFKRSASLTSTALPTAYLLVRLEYLLTWDKSVFEDE